MNDVFVQLYESTSYSSEDFQLIAYKIFNALSNTTTNDLYNIFSTEDIKKIKMSKIGLVTEKLVKLNLITYPSVMSQPQTIQWSHRSFFYAWINVKSQITKY